MKKEEWKAIDFLNGNYSISNMGRIRNNGFFSKATKPRYIQPKIMALTNNIGYSVITINAKTYKIHRLVAMHFIPNPENKPCVNHINSIRNDNVVSNLEWCTNTENQRHSWKFGGRKLSQYRIDKLAEARKNIPTTDKAVFDCEMGIFYNSRREASEAFGITPSAMSFRVLRGTFNKRFLSL